MDHDGQIIQPTRTGQTTVEISVMDINDEAPKFLRKVYQGFMNNELTRLRNDLIVEVISCLNSEIIHSKSKFNKFEKWMNVSSIESRFRCSLSIFL